MEQAHRRGATICVVLDDFGLHPGINAAAQRLAQLGRVQAIGALVGAPAWQQGTDLLRRLDAQGLDIGLHLDLTEAPLRSSGRPLPSLILAAYVRGLDMGLLQREIHAQLDAFEAALCHPPAFVDGHQHVHQLPGVREALVAALKDRCASSRPWVRCARGPDRSTKARVIRALGARALEALLRERGFPHNRRLLGVYAFDGGEHDYRRRLAAWLREARDGDLLMCHAGLDSPPDDPLCGAREAEYAALTDPSFDRLLASHGITLQPMSRILARSAA